jgi:hypothetical protein
VVRQAVEEVRQNFYVALSFVDLVSYLL